MWGGLCVVSDWHSTLNWRVLNEVFSRYCEFVQYQQVLGGNLALACRQLGRGER